ncbi:hypothetical protein PGO68_23395 [Klebsiella aerogenes]
MEPETAAKILCISQHKNRKMTLLNHETRYYLEVATLLKEDIDDYNFYCRSNNVPCIIIWRSVSYKRFDVVCSWEHLEHKNHEVVCHPLFGPCVTAYAEKQLKKLITSHDWRGPTPPTLELSRSRQLVTFRLIQTDPKKIGTGMTGFIHIKIHAGFLYQADAGETILLMRL